MHSCPEADFKCQTNLNAQILYSMGKDEAAIELLDLRSKVEKSETITDGLGDKLDKYTTEIEDLWTAFDEAVKNPLQ
jgi:hypothetical protein